jgi:ribonuclease Z
MAAALEVVLLGTGSPMYNPARCGAGNVVIGGDTQVVVDLGWGAARRLPAANLGRGNSIDHLCLTHMHSDHITDIPDFLMQRWTGGATTPLRVYGPEGTRETVLAFQAGLRLDVEYRVAHHGEKNLPRSGWEIEIIEVPATPQPSPVTTIGDLEIEAFEVDHWPAKPALGFRFQRNGRTVVFSGDTRKCLSLIDGSRDADVLVCEAMNRGMWDNLVNVVRTAGNERGAAILDDVPSYHITTLETAEVAREAGVRHLVLSHLLPQIPAEGPGLDGFTEGMKEIYGGPITVGRDLQRITIEE